MKVYDSTEALREYLRGQKAREKSVAFVPTMGALHDGHKSCIDIGRRRGDVLVVSIFVNPTQFGPAEDYDSYPRVLDADLALCERWGCDVVYAPAVEAVYPKKQLVWIEVEKLSEPLCGRTRIGFFRGIATVVMKLFHIVEPDVAVFGQKDAQQAIVIREMAEELNLPIEIVLSPVVREKDGLALSSRNAYLTADERRRAGGIYAGLIAGKEAIARGESNPERVVGAVTDKIRASGIGEIEYVEVLKANDLSPVGRILGKVIIAAAARVGRARLIDNFVLDIRGDGAVEEVLLF